MPALFLILACALWGVSFPMIKALQLEQSARLPEASSAFLAVWLQVARFALAAVLLLPIVVKPSRPTRSEWRQGLLLAWWGGLGMGLQAWGLAFTAASTSAFLTQAYCVILPLIACFRTRKLPSIRIAGATALVMAGGAMLSGIEPGSLVPGRGETATIIAALFFTLQILTLEAPRYAENRGGPVTFIMCAGIAVLFLPAAMITAPHPSVLLGAGASLPAFVLLFGLALFCSVGAYLLMNTWQKRVSSTEAGLIYTTEPVFTAVYALFLPAPLSRFVGAPYPNETLTLTLLAGGGLILAANLWMQAKSRPHRPSVAPAP